MCVHSENRPFSALSILGAVSRMSWIRAESLKLFWCWFSVFSRGSSAEQPLWVTSDFRALFWCHCIFTVTYHLVLSQADFPITVEIQVHLLVFNLYKKNEVSIMLKRIITMGTAMVPSAQMRCPFICRLSSNSSFFFFFLPPNIYLFIFKYIYWLCYYSCPIPPQLHSILPTPSLPHSPPIVHVHGSCI